MRSQTAKIVESFLSRADACGSDKYVDRPVRPDEQAKFFAFERQGVVSSELKNAAEAPINAS
jgi:hypothetical protein